MIVAVLGLLLGAQTASSTQQTPHTDEGDQAPARRYALVVGANDGGPGRQKLRFAVSDGRAFAAVMRELGGVGADDQVFLAEPSSATLTETIGALGRTLSKAERKGRVEFVFYYSGHSDETGLLLGRERLLYSELKGALAMVPADVRIAVLDSCSAGSMLRGKGGSRRPSFLQDESTQVRGHAFIVSSAATEAALESERLKASFFTHHLMSGLRGAADATRDGRVTLFEAYQYAFHETLAGTETTVSGAQHAGYDMQLSGSGDVVMTDLRLSISGITFGAEFEGRFFVRDESERLVAEIKKSRGGIVEIGVGPGDYRVLFDDGKNLLQAKIHVDADRRLVLERLQLHAVGREAGTRRGSEAKDDSRMVPLALSLLPMMSTNTLYEHPSNQLAFNLFVGSGHGLRGFELGVGVNHRRGDVSGVQIAGLGNMSEGTASGVQLALLGNINTQRTQGLSLALGFNYGAELRGVQLAALNVAGDVTGAQLGLVNIGGTVTGLQLGLINVADEADAALGLASFISNGRLDLDVWGSDAGLANASVRFGSRYFYTSLHAGFDPLHEPRHWLAGLGWGTHLPFKRHFFFDVEIAGNLLQRGLRFDNEHSAFLLRTKVAVGVSLHESFALFAGPTFNILAAEDENIAAFAFAPSYAAELDGTMRAWLGLAVGLRISR